MAWKSQHNQSLIYKAHKCCMTCNAILANELSRNSWQAKILLPHLTKKWRKRDDYREKYFNPSSRWSLGVGCKHLNWRGRRRPSEDGEEWTEWGRSFSAHKSKRKKGSTFVCARATLLPPRAMGQSVSWARRSEGRKQGQEDKRDRRGHLEKSEGKRPGGEKKPTAGGNKIQSKPVGSPVVFLQENKVPEDCFFFSSVNEKYFYPHKRKD